MDNQILRELFAACVEAQSQLGVDTEHSMTLKSMAAKLPADKIGSKGQLLEWGKDYPELTLGMGHISHLFAAFPGSSIKWYAAPELMKAVRKSLDIRVENGAGAGGWPLAWFINIYARQLDGEMVEKSITKMLTNSTRRNLLNARAVFKIDGNLGVTAGIAECLLQSHIALHLLPALPLSWREGSVKGLRARGSYEVDIDWKEDRLTHAVINPQWDGLVEVVGELLNVECEGERVTTENISLGFIFAGEGSKVYHLTPPL